MRAPAQAAQACHALVACRPMQRRAPAAVALGRQCRAFAGRAHFDGFPGGFGGFPGQAGAKRGDSDKFYNLLGVDRSCNEKQLKQAYKKQAMQHHPDKGGDDKIFKEISRAYEVLTDPEKRQIYDQYGEEGVDNLEQGGGGGGHQAGMDPFDLFSSIFGFNAAGGQRRQRGRPVTPDSVYELQLGLEELYAGAKRDIVFNRDATCGSCEGKGGTDTKKCMRCDGTGVQVTLQQLGIMVQQVQSPCSPCGGKGYTIPPDCTCKACRGKGTIKEKKNFDIDIEAGAKDGTEYRFRRQADERPGHDAGDVVIVLREKTHKTFQRIQDSLIMSKRLSLTEALCGFQFSTTFLDGEELVVRSTPGQVLKPGTLMIIEGKGMPRAHGQKPGDLFLNLEVDFPNSVSPEAQERILAALGGEALPAEAPLGAAAARPLSERQTQEVKRKFANSAREQEAGRQRGRGGGEAGGADCVQQ